MTMKKIILSLLITCFAAMEIFAAIETPSTQGSEFYFSFIRALPGREKTMVLTVSAAKSGKIKFTDAYGTETIKTFAAGTTDITLAHLKSVSISNPDDAENGDETEVAAIENLIVTDPLSDLPYCYTIRTNQVQDRGYVVETFEDDGTTPQKVSLYAGLSGSKTVDVANVYPIDALGNEYYVLSHPGDRTNSEHIDGNCEALVVATEDNTVIEITPTCLMDDQTQYENIHGVITITLNKGQTYQVRAQSPLGADAGRNDLTGTLIRVKDDGDMSATGNTCKKIAVFVGTQHGNPGDYEYEQIFPRHLWGKEYLVDAPGDGGVSVVRVGASEPCTHVSINGVEVAVLNQTDFYDYVDINSTGAYVQTDKPVQVGMFTRPYEGQNGDNISQSNDAAMIVIAPIEQRLDSIVFSAIYNVDANQHYVSITTPTESVDSLSFYRLVGGVWTEIPLAGWSDIPANQEYSSVVYHLTTPTVSYNPTYKLISKKGGFNAYLYGFGVDKDEYGYSVGAAAATVKTTFTLNGFNAESLTKDSCIVDAVELSPVLPGDLTVSQIEWDFESDNTIDTVTFASNDYKAYHVYSVPQEYKLTMYVWKDVNCFSKFSVDTVEANFRVKDYTPVPTRHNEYGHCYGDILTTSVNTILPVDFPGYDPSKLVNTWTILNEKTGDVVMDTDSAYNHPNIDIINDYGDTLIYIKHSWLLSSPCYFYVDTFNVSVKDSTLLTAISLTNLCYGKEIPSTPYNQTNYPDLQSGGTPTYVWYNASGDSVGNEETLVLPDDYNTSTTYTRTLTTGCKYVEPYTISIKDSVEMPDVVVGYTCHGVTIASYDPTAYPDLVGTPTYVWYDASGDSIGNGETLVLPDDFGASFEYTRTLTTGCKYYETYTGTIKPRGGVQYSDTTLCTGNTIVWNRDGYNSSDLIAPITYQWYDADMNPIAGATSSSYDVPNVYGEDAKYYVSATGYCEYLDTYNIHIPTEIFNGLIADTAKVCGDGSTPVTISAIIDGDATSTVWEQSNDGGAAFKTITPTTENTYVYNPTETLIFRLTSSGQCQSGVISPEVEVEATSPFTVSVVVTSPDFTNAEKHILPQSGGTVSIEAVVDFADPIYTSSSLLYEWYPDTTISKLASSFSQDFKAEQADDVTYYVVVTDQSGCTVMSEDSITVRMKMVELHTLLIPGSLDSKNHTFAKVDQYGDDVKTSLGDDYKTTIFNRYGQQVFSSVGEGWDCTVDGEIADAGVYFYVIEYYPTSGAKQLKGSVEVIR